MTLRTTQRGSALIGALFLIIIVGALGVFAMNMQANQRQEQVLQLLQQRVEFAARSGIEYWMFQIGSARPCNSGDGPDIGNGAGFSGISLITTCTAIPTGPSGPTVHSVEVRASHGNFGDPDFVQRTLRRTIIR